MAISQQSVHLQPARSIDGTHAAEHKAFCHPTVSTSWVRSHPFAGVLAFLLSGFVHADNLTAALTDGTFLSSEQQTHSLEQLGLSLSTAALPDPASFLPKSDAAASSSGSRHTLWFDDVAWITGIGTLLFRDSDRDGYHAGFSLTIDADTSRNLADVYVSIDMQRYFGPRERLHTSASFSLYGHALTDEYQIDIDLLQNYPADNYDLFIELHDTYDHRVLDRVSAENFSNLAGLPLESEDLDNFYDPMPVRPFFPPANDDIRAEEYTGSAGVLTTLGLSLVLWVRRRRRCAE